MLTAIVFASTAVATAVVHIDLAGSDNSPLTDGSAERPFRTVAGWKERARRTATFPRGGIQFGPGVHDLVTSGGLQLGTAGTEGAPFVVSGAGVGVTQLSAGTKVPQFKEQRVPVTRRGGTGSQATELRQWTTTMPAGTTYFRQLFVRPSNATANFSRRSTARSPLMAYNHTDMSDPQHSIVYNPGQVKPSYHNQADVLATLFHCWTATTHRIRIIEPSNRTLTLLQAPHVDIPRCEHASGKRCVTVVPFGSPSQSMSQCQLSPSVVLGQFCCR
jgi:hypothetical protein